MWFTTFHREGIYWCRRLNSANTVDISFLFDVHAPVGMFSLAHAIYAQFQVFLARMRTPYVYMLSRYRSRCISTTPLPKIIQKNRLDRNLGSFARRVASELHHTSLCYTFGSKIPFAGSCFCSPFALLFSSIDRLIIFMLCSRHRQGRRSRNLCRDRDRKTSENEISFIIKRKPHKSVGVVGSRVRERRTFCPYSSFLEHVHTRANKCRRTHFWHAVLVDAFDAILS